MDAPSTTVGLDGEEIDTVCELKGLSLQLTYGAALERAIAGWIEEHDR